MTRKFTQEELEAAFKQMRDERNAEAKQAEKAAEWVEQQLGSENNAHTKGESSSYTRYSPYKIRYVIILTCQTYGPYLKDFTDKLDVVEWAIKDKADENWVPGFDPKGLRYKLTTPYGDYPLMFNYFDNHCTGW